MIDEYLGGYFIKFGDDARFQGGIDPVRVIYNAPSERLLEGGVLARVPTAGIRTSDVPDSMLPGHALEVLSGHGVGNYTVREHQPDGTGMSMLLLRKAAP